jgi:hypothetical protein
MTRICPACGRDSGFAVARCPTCGARMGNARDRASDLQQTLVARSADAGDTVVARSPGRSARGAHLFVKEGPSLGRTFSLGDKVIVGRGEQCEVRLSDPEVSGQHAQIKRSRGSYTYLDLQSENGSYLNLGGRFERLTSHHALADGDEIRLGNTVLQFIRTPKGGEQ